MSSKEDDWESYCQFCREKSRGLDCQCQLDVELVKDNDTRCDEGGMQFPLGVEMASLLTGERVCLCNGAGAGG